MQKLMLLMIEYGGVISIQHEKSIAGLRITYRRPADRISEAVSQTVVIPSVRIAQQSGELDFQCEHMLRKLQEHFNLLLEKNNTPRNKNYTSE